MKSKICKYCKKLIIKEDMIIQAGYLSTACRPCKRKEARKYAKKKKDLLKGTFWEAQK